MLTATNELLDTRSALLCEKRLAVHDKRMLLAIAREELRVLEQEHFIAKQQQKLLDLLIKSPDQSPAALDAIGHRFLQELS